MSGFNYSLLYYTRDLRSLKLFFKIKKLKSSKTVMMTSPHESDYKSVVTSLSTF